MIGLEERRFMVWTDIAKKPHGRPIFMACLCPILGWNKFPKLLSKDFIRLFGIGVGFFSKKGTPKSPLERCRYQILSSN
jgi:hypothetical protein